MDGIIWVIDDDHTILAVTELLLAEAGYKVKLINNNVSLENSLRKGVFPNLILLDVLIPGASGVDISRKIKARKDTKDIPIIIMSADINLDKKAKEARADGYIRKPYDIEELETLIKKYIK